MEELELVAEIAFEKSNSTSTKRLLFSAYPTTFQAIKTRIEECFSIPACVLKVIYQDNEVLDCWSPRSFYVRSGDVLRVVCPAEGDVAEVQCAVEWLEKCVQVLEDLWQKREHRGHKIKKLSMESSEILLNARSLNLIRSGLFGNWSNPSSEVNCYHFHSVGGVKVLVRFHKLLVQFRQESEFVRYCLCLESVCCQGISLFCSNNELSAIMAHSGGLESCIGTLLIKPVPGNAMQTVLMALRAIYNIADCPNLPEVLHSLANNAEVIQQVLDILTSSHSSQSCKVDCMGLLICLSRCRSGHHNLLTQDVVEKLPHFAKTTGRNSRSISDQMLLKCYVGLYLAQMILCSHQLLTAFPIHLLEKMMNLLQEAADISPLELQHNEERRGIVWGTFIHSIHCLYEPTSTPQYVADLIRSSIIESLRSKSLNVMLVYLQSCLCRSDHVEVLINEQMFDYVLMLPWTLPPHLHDKASLIVQGLSKFRPVKPTSLLILSKAILAINTCGLHELSQVNSISELLS